MSLKNLELIANYRNCREDHSGAKVAEKMLSGKLEYYRRVLIKSIDNDLEELTDLTDEFEEELAADPLLCKEVIARARETIKIILGG